MMMDEFSIYQSYVQWIDNEIWGEKKNFANLSSFQENICAGCHL